LLLTGWPGTKLPLAVLWSRRNRLRETMRELIWSHFKVSANCYGYGKIGGISG